MSIRAIKWAGSSSVVALLAYGIVVAAPPTAGERIGNKAAATYNSGGQSFTVDSNEVTTVVNQVYGVDIDPDQSRIVAPGNFVYFPHQITNNANTGDIFDLSSTVTAGATNLTGSILIFADANQDGVPDSTTPITSTTSVAAGSDFSVVVRAQVANTAADGATASFTVTATSQGDGNQTDFVTDDLTVDTGGIIDITKSQLLANDADNDGVFSQGDTVQVRLSYANNGLSDASTISISDILKDVNADGESVTLTYVNNATYPTSWSDASGSIDDSNSPTAIDLTSGQGENLSFTFDAPTREVTADFDNIIAGNAGEIIFHYVITTAPEGQLDNVATVTSLAQPTPVPSNTSSFTIAGTLDVVLADSSATSSGGANVGDDVSPANLNGVTTSATDDDSASNDIVEENTDRFPGQTIQFEMVLTNLSDVQESFVLSTQNIAHTGSTNFPSGTTFTFVEADGSTPIVSNTVTVGAGLVRSVRVIATLPSSLTPTTTTNYEATVTATSSADAGVVNAAGILFSGEILGGTVDLTDESNGLTGDVGPNVENGTLPWETATATPTAAATFPMSLSVPAGQPASSFDLNAFGDDAFATGIPAGWNVRFLDGTGTPITNTGTLTPSPTTAATFNFTVEVLPPAGAPATATPEDIYIQAISPVTGASDAIYYTVGVAEVVDVAISSDTTAQVAEGGVITIQHTLTNNGNTTVTAGTVGIATTSNAGGDLDGLPDDPFTDSGMTASLYWDADASGGFSAGDVQITDISDISGGIAPGSNIRLFVRVQAPSGIAAGTSESGDVAVGTTLTTSLGAGATDSNAANNEVNDTVVVISGDLVLNKVQGVDIACNGNLTDGDDSAFTAADINADPGACIIYQITASNTGTQDATDVVITDAVPGFTTIETCGGACTPSYTVNGGAATAITTPGDEATGTLSTAPGFTLLPGQVAVLTFSVQVDE